MKRAILVAAILCLGGAARAADSAAAHAHARKANSLAASGKCKQAIPEYNAAYRLLKDPALLFNRAECQRKLGRGAQALSDYRKFLEEMPDAPNRGVVEGRIAALDPDAGVQAKPLVQTPAPVVEMPTTIASRPAPPVAEREPALHAAALRTPLPAPEPGPAPVAAVPMLAVRPQPAEAPSAEGRAWLWLSVAAAVVAASAGGALYLTGKPHNP